MQCACVPTELPFCIHATVAGWELSFCHNTSRGRGGGARRDKRRDNMGNIKTKASEKTILIYIFFSPPLSSLPGLRNAWICCCVVFLCCLVHICPTRHTLFFFVYTKILPKTVKKTRNQVFKILTCLIETLRLATFSTPGNPALFCCRSCTWPRRRTRRRCSCRTAGRGRRRRKGRRGGCSTSSPSR